MREGFFYRLHGLEIRLPPLRDRKADIPLLVTHFLARAEGDQVPMRLFAPLLKRVMEYDWPGNVRELQQALQRYAATGRLTFAYQPDDEECATFQN
jgi:DNA-binding NtrC family response regulator